jgi:negative regulator of flagellin synthesis FlgM
MDIKKLGSDRVSQQEAAQTQKSHASKATAQNSEAANATQTSQTAKTSLANNVKWSADAKLATEALALAKAAPDTRSEKVAALKAAIANGSYKVDSSAVADRMIESSLEDDLLTRNG